jgi:1-acyl-sn-glycerol-3-phosphate acyltransferase
MIATILVFLYVIVSMIFLLPFGFIAIFLYALGLKKSMTQVIYLIVKGWGYSMIIVTGSKVTFSGRENIPKKGGVCFVSNHEGYFDIVLMMASCGRSIGFIAKKELSYIPVLNIWIILIGGLFIDRGTVRKALKTIHKGVERIKSGGGMIIFPEGHRAKGSGIQPFHPGSLKLATQAEAPIVPVAITGSYNVFEKDDRVRRSSLKITFCPVIPTAGLSVEDKKALSDKIYNVIKTALDEHRNN